MEGSSERDEAAAGCGDVRFPGAGNLSFSATVLTGPQHHRCGVSTEIVLRCGWVCPRSELFLA